MKDGEHLDYDKFLAENGANIEQLKGMLQQESSSNLRKEAMHKKGVKTGGNA